MVVGHDHRHAARLEVGDLAHGGNSVVHRHHKPHVRMFGEKASDRRGGEAVAFLETVGDERIRQCAEATHGRDEDRARAHAVAVVVAVHHDLASVAHERQNDLRSLPHARQRVHAHQTRKRRIEELLSFFRAYSPLLKQSLNYGMQIHAPYSTISRPLWQCYERRRKPFTISRRCWKRA